MVRRSVCVFLSVVFVGLSDCSSVLVAADELQLGLAKTEITPPVGYRMSGYFSQRLCTGVHDPLYAKTLVLTQGEKRVALVFCDLIGISPAVARRAREIASQRTNIANQHILIAATHSHTGPLYFGALRSQFRKATIQKHGDDPHEKVDYARQLSKKIADSIVDAFGKRQRVSLNVGFGIEKRLSFNRRFHMRDGSVRFNPGRLNPQIVRVAGPIDPQVGMLLFKDRSGSPLASLTLFALHLDTVGGTKVSADFPFYLQKTMAEKLGQDFLSVFAAGTCGDINHIDVTRRTQLKGQEESRRIGTTLGETVLATIPTLASQKQPSLDVRTTTISLPLQSYSAEEVKQAAADMQKIGSRGLSFLEQVRAYKITALRERGGKTMPVLIQTFRLSPETALVGLPGEVFVDLGLEIKRRSPFKHTLVIELSGDAPGYVPTRKAFAEGSYETVNSRISPGGGERIVEVAVELLSDLHPG